jgi:hypothetical protein
MRTSDRLLLNAVRVWSLVSNPGVWRRALRSKTGLFPNPALPATDTDKFLWRKIFDHNPLFSMCCDKLAAKDYALRNAPRLKTAKVLWTGTDPHLIPTDLLTGNVLVKANHASGWNIIVRNGQLDRDDMLRRASRWARTRYARFVGEWGYKHAWRGVLVEQMLQEPDGRPISTEYKFHTSGGRTGYIYVRRRNADGTENWCVYDRDGTPVPVDPQFTTWLAMPMPENFGAMRDIAETLASAFDHIRVDLYNVGGEVYFSELTVYPQSGKSVASPRLAELRSAGWDLRKSWFLSTPQRGWRKHYAEALRRWLDESRPTAVHPAVGEASPAKLSR